MLRAATAGDLPFLREMLYEAAFRTRPRPPIDEALADPAVAVYVEDWGRAGDVGVVDTDRDTAQGAAWFRSFTDAHHGYGFVDDATPELAVACRPGARGRGVGRRLVQALLDQARAHGAPRLSLSVSLRNPRARLLYFDCGFADVPGQPARRSRTMVAETDPTRRPAPVVVRERTERDLDDEQLRNGSWGEIVVSLAQVFRPAELAGLIAEVDGQPAGLATWRLDGGDGLEVVTIDAWHPDRGVGSALLRAARHVARSHGRARIWLLTTNDNLPALRFYQQRGFDLVALHRHEVDQARDLKPTIPTFGLHGIPLHHGLELELRLER